MTDISEEQRLKELDDARILSQAEELAAAKVQELQASLGKALNQDNPDEKYNSISDMKNDMSRRAREEAAKIKEEIRQEFEEEKKKAKEAEEQKIKQTQEEQQKEWAKMTEEWKEAVSDGIAPPIADELSQKLAKGAKYDELSEAEKNDPGLVFYNAARKQHAELKREGKAGSFYRTITKFDSKPSSSSAPIFGGSVATPPATEEFTDSDLNEATNKVMNMGLPT